MPDIPPTTSEGMLDDDKLYREQYGEEPPGSESESDEGCPWCDDYTGDAVPQHASSAHPDEWAEHKA